jgi:hypothetical protein
MGVLQLGLAFEYPKAFAQRTAILRSTVQFGSSFGDFVLIREWRSIVSEVNEKSGGEIVAKRRDLGLMGRALHERWEIPEAVRGPLMIRLSAIVEDPSAAPQDVLAAAGVLLAASKINLANIATSINAEKHEELELRVTEMEQRMAARSKAR